MQGTRAFIARTFRHETLGDEFPVHRRRCDRRIARCSSSPSSTCSRGTPTSRTASLAAIVAEYATIGYGNYAAVERASNTVIGHCGAHHVAGRDRVEADFALGKAWWGRGLATEAASAVFLRAFVIDDVTEIVGIAHRDNAASIAVMRKLGMERQSDVVARNVPSVLYALKRQDLSLPTTLYGRIQLFRN